MKEGSERNCGEETEGKKNRNGRVGGNLRDDRTRNMRKEREREGGGERKGDAEMR